MHEPIYMPRGRAKEYGNYAINIYTGCPHNCYYCFSPSVLRQDKNSFHTNVEPRNDIVERTKKQLSKGNIQNELIHLCFVCDPYPLDIFDTSTTREIIKAIKESGNHVQILTKNGADAQRDFDLLDENDWFGITYAGYENFHDDCVPNEEPGTGNLIYRINALSNAAAKGIKTWVSAEPVLNTKDVLDVIKTWDFVDMWKIGKLNYYSSDVNWVSFGIEVINICEKLKRNYIIKEDLQKEVDNFLLYNQTKEGDAT